MAEALTSYTARISSSQGDRIREYLEARGFAFSAPQYTHFSAKSRTLVVSFYQSGKLLVQGKGTTDFVEFFLEPDVLQSASLGYELDLNPEQLQPHIGVDESGKGDFFGPLVIAAVYLDEPVARRLHQAGVQDSKKIQSARKIQELDQMIASTPGCISDVVVLGNTAYNRLYEKFRNLNQLLAWGHARAVENVLNKIPDQATPPDFILSDQFARSPSVVQRALLEKSRRFRLVQRTKAESDIAVAAASIRARARFVESLSAMGKKCGHTLPKGASKQVAETAIQIATERGADALAELSKSHFQTFQSAIQSAEERKKS